MEIFLKNLEEVFLDFFMIRKKINDYIYKPYWRKQYLLIKENRIIFGSENKLLGKLYEK